MKGLRGSSRVSPSGRATRAVDTGKQHSELSALREVAIVFPDVPIGVGATWKEITQESIGGVVWDRTATYRLRGLADSIATVDADVTMHASNQAISVEPNSTTTLTSGTSNTTAQLTIPLHGLVSTATSQSTNEANFLLVRHHLRISSTTQTELSSSTRSAP
jgi:hypothetical protein